ncbi:preprotein translocase subunit SecG [Asticcacaulis sp. 201]|uniref:preprotein translocase subunit SecG n=1 Tax=Asticcacaulis sp. 201 TaxID=3028787 RepID=UPI0029171106|nr:preprotein translocase subunit SecG [Asticcacaulis sp. 201]MDV6329333.1 preprotein translocase subunit SecG [Asticcacaulis sp. 201]
MNTLFGILLTVQILVSVTMAGLILIQRSEGGALGMGGGPSGFMSARGAGNLLTKLTAIFAFIFFVNSIGLTIAGNYSQRTTSAVDQVDTSGLTIDKSKLPAAPAASQTASSAGPSLSDLPLANSQPAAPAPQAQVPAQAPTPKPATSSAPARLPANSAASSSVSQKQVEAAKAGIWQGGSSAAPASSATTSSASR